MQRLAALVVLLAIASGACSSSPEPLRVAAPLTPTATSTATAAPTGTFTPTATTLYLPTPALPTAQRSSSLAPPAGDSAATPTPTRFSEVLSSVQTPDAPPAVRGGTTLPVPDGTTVVFGGCASDGQCYWFNFYWSPTHEAVLQNGESQIKVQHELCHAHQHWSINDGQPLSPFDYDLHTWNDTAEGRSFDAAVSGLSWPWSQSAVNNLEDFAWTCAYYYLDPAHLQQVSPERYDWAVANLP